MLQYNIVIKITDIKIGQGFDIHRLVENKPLILGGVKIDYPKGLEGHSDADVLIHSIMDALLGAAGLNDIGYYFPNTDNRYKDISSLILLKEVVKLLNKKKYKIINIDSTILTEKPLINPYIKKMKQNIAKVLNLSQSNIGIKATTTEKMGAIGREEGIGALSIALIYKN